MRRARRFPPCFRSRRSIMITNYRMLDRAPGQRLMTVCARDIERIEEYDPDPDLSYLEPDASPEYAAQNAERLAAYRAGAWHCIGRKARASFLLGLGEVAVIQTVASPGPGGLVESGRAAGG